MSAQPRLVLGRRVRQSPRGLNPTNDDAARTLGQSKAPRLSQIHFVKLKQSTALVVNHRSIQMIKLIFVFLAKPEFNQEVFVFWFLVVFCFFVFFVQWYVQQSLDTPVSAQKRGPRESL